VAKPITINGVKYSSSVKAAQALFSVGGTTPTHVHKTLIESGSDITYSSVYAFTAGMEQTNIRRNKYRILNMGKTGRKTAGDIAKKTGLTTSKVISILKKAGISIKSKEEIDINNAEKNLTRRTRYRILNMGKTGKKTAGELAKKTGTTNATVISTIKNAGIEVPTKKKLVEAKARKMDKKNTNTQKVPQNISKKQIKKTPATATKKTSKTKQKV